MIFAGACAFPTQFLFTELAYHAGGAANHQLICVKFCGGFHKSRCANNGVFTDVCAIHHHGIHANERITTNAAAVQNGTVADMPIDFYHGILLWEPMHDAVILNVRAVLHHDAAKVAAQAGVGPDIYAFADNHIAN